MKVEPGMAQMSHAISKLVQCSRASAQRCRNFRAFAKVESFQRGLSREMGKRRAKISYHTAEIAPQCRDGNIVADVQRRELLRKVVPVRVRQHPLREIIRKPLGEEVMAPQRLIRVMEDRSVAATFQPREQL